MDTKNNKIVGFGCADKQGYYHPEETFAKSSNLLESEAFRRLLDQLDCKEKVTGFVIDGDNKNPGILQQDDFNPPIFRDPNHLSLSFNRYLDQQLSENKRMIDGISDCFRNLREKIKKWYSFLIHSPLDIDTKKAAWLNTVSHLLGYHENCLYHKYSEFCQKIGLEHDECAEKLYFILLARVNDFDGVIYGGSTQQNESFHKVQLSFGGKDVVYPRSQITRDYFALLKYNEGPKFEFEMRKRLHLPELDLYNQEKIQNEQENAEAMKVMLKKPEYQKKMRKYKKKKASLNKSQKGDYKPPENESSDDDSSEDKSTDDDSSESE